MWQANSVPDVINIKFGTFNVFSQERFLGLKLKINLKKAQSCFKPNTWVAVLFFE